MSELALLDYDGTRYLTEKLKIMIANIVPVGSILMWSGSVGSIPIGYALCDGQNGTPDLRGRFVLGADDGKSDSSYSVGTRGGGGDPHSYSR